LKTPVAIQKSSIQLLLHQQRSAEEYKQGLQQVLLDTERLEDLLQRLLRLARADLTASGAGVRDLQRVSIPDSCEAAMNRMQPFAESRGVDLKFCSTGQATVQADPDDLLVIWSNLLENAIRYSARGQTVSLSVNGSKAGSTTVRVTDEGCGIAQEHLSRIFERFYRGDQSRARDTGGSGLGLAIVKALVEGYAGSVAVTSELGHGSTFEVALPQAGP
jgi:signal transduction histidine kinase